MTHLFQTACLLGLAFLTSLPLRATDTETLSPDQSIRVTLSCPADGPTGFSVNYQDKEVFRHINLGLQTDRRAWEQGLTLRSASEATLHTDDYTLLSGKRLGKQLLNKRRLSGSEKAGYNINLGHFLILL